MPIFSPEDGPTKDPRGERIIRISEECHHDRQSDDAFEDNSAEKTPKMTTPGDLSTKENDIFTPTTPPSRRVQFILDEEDGEDSLECRPLFSEMVTLNALEDGEYEWTETARWVKFEEVVEESGKRWSKPHVPSLSLQSVFELRSTLTNGTVVLNIDAFHISQIASLLSDIMINEGYLPAEVKETFIGLLLKKHKHLYEKQEKGGKIMKSIRSIQSFKSSSDLKGSNTYNSLTPNRSGLNQTNGSMPQIEYNGVALDPLQTESTKGNRNFMRKIPVGAEAANILVGEVDFLKSPVSAFVRLSNSAVLGNMTEVALPTRFMFIVLGPQGGLPRYHETGRAMATLLSDEVFNAVAYKSKNRNHLLAGVDEFLGAVTCLPPGSWDPSIRIEPPSAIPSQEARKGPIEELEVDEEEEERRLREAAGLMRTGRLFGGLVNDIKRKAPWYWSDFKDGFSMQSLATFFFLYFACLTPIITFGGLLGDATGNNVAAMESLVSGLISGVIYGLFSAQPLTILGSTGPVLVFEGILYDFCHSNKWDFLAFRMWTGIWATIILLLLVAFDASAYVCYVTRFTEENFATLIALIFIYKAIEKVMSIGTKYPIETHTGYYDKSCSCYIDNSTDETQDAWYSMNNSTSLFNLGNSTVEACENASGIAITEGCSTYYPDVFLLSIILFCSTFIIATKLKKFKTARFFPSWVRNAISDFAVILAIISMTLLDMFIGIQTPKLIVPAEIKPTLPNRGWMATPFGPIGQNPWWTALAAIVPGILVSILFFMDQQITAVIVNRKENKLKKGGGFHLDLFVLSLLIALKSVMGLPWFVAATVRSMNHVNSLKQETECAAPGEKPQFLGVRENRVTHLLIHLVIGLSVLMTPILSRIPMPVLFGVFMYMGVAALNGIQFFERILVMFMPVKYQPDYTFLRRVPLSRIHLFTFFQLVCFVFLWVIKSFPQTSIFFPLMLVVMVGIRKLLDFVFTQSELKILDDCLPEFKRKEKIAKEDGKEELEMQIEEEKVMSIPLSNGNIMKIPFDQLNISEEVKKSAAWKTINNDSQKNSDSHEFHSEGVCKSCKKRRGRNSGNKFEKTLYISVDQNEDSVPQSSKKNWEDEDAKNEEEKNKLNV